MIGNGEEGRKEGVGVAGAINGNADRRGDVRRRNRSIDGAIFGRGRRQHWAVQLELLVAPSTTGFGWT